MTPSKLSSNVRLLLDFKPLRYLFAGGTGAVVNLATLFILVSEFRVWYLVGTIAAFIVSTGVSFILQKIVTFSDRSLKGTHLQVGVFVGIALCNLGVNTILMFGAVGVLHMQYLLSQFLVNIVIAIYSFFLYKYLVFRN